MKFTALFSLLLSTQLWASWSVSTYNIRNFDKEPSGPEKHEELAKVIKEVKSDVMAFEEVVNREAFKTLIAKSLPGFKVRLSNCGGSGKQNLAIAYNPKSFTFVEEYEDMNFSGGSSSGCGSLRPVFFVTLTHMESDEDYTFGVVHLKAGGDTRAMTQRWQQYQKLTKVAGEYEDYNLILLGDFNTTGYNLQDEDFDQFVDFLGSAGMRTTSEEIACTNYWNGGRSGGKYQPSLLDHIVLQDRIAGEVKSVELGAHCAQQECRPATTRELGATFNSASDHCPVKVTFK